MLQERRRVIILDPILEYPGQMFDDLSDMIDHIQTHSVFMVRSQWPHELSMLCAIANAAHNTTLVIEEAQTAIPESNRPLPSSLEHTIYRGRHWNTSLVIVAQRAATVHIAARSQWSRLVTFNQSEKSDVIWLEGQLGIDRDVFKTLPPLYGIYGTPFHAAKPFRLDFDSGTKGARMVSVTIPNMSRDDQEDI